MADYQLTASAVVIRTADQAHIPDDPGNTDRVKYDKWIADGGVPDPYVPPPTPEPTPPAGEVSDVVLLDHENRLRVIEGQPPITAADFNKRIRK